jgi:CBS domain containing-hemolysin-like protein
MQNLLSLKQVKVRQAMTHRTVVFSLPDTMTIEQFLEHHADVSFSRIPIYEDGEPEKITGYVLKSDLLLAYTRDNRARELKTFQKDMVTILSSMSLANAFAPLHSQRGNMLLVDEYGGLEGVLTVEDLVESLFGIDIIDESDQVVSMRKLARILAKRREKKRLRMYQKTNSSNSN